MRAMTVRVDATAAVEGWARSGTVVDVLLVEKNRTTVVAEQVKIISTERSLSTTTSSSTAAIPTTVTLLVTQEQCLAINTAVALGRIAFALRSGADPDRWRDTHFVADDLNGSINKHAAARIEGAVTVGVGGAKKNYALVNGRWVPSDAPPTGFFVSKKVGLEGPG
jgi:Flp pilus assembly protein CpaB